MTQTLAEKDAVKQQVAMRTASSLMSRFAPTKEEGEFAVGSAVCGLRYHFHDKEIVEEARQDWQLTLAELWPMIVDRTLEYYNLPNKVNAKLMAQAEDVAIQRGGELIHRLLLGNDPLSPIKPAPKPYLNQPREVGDKECVLTFSWVMPKELDMYPAKCTYMITYYLATIRKVGNEKEDYTYDRSEPVRVHLATVYADHIETQAR